jgi:hypothetical protein
MGMCEAPPVMLGSWRVSESAAVDGSGEQQAAVGFGT